jgi:hypothetical protein
MFYCAYHLALHCKRQFQNRSKQHMYCQAQALPPRKSVIQANFNQRQHGIKFLCIHLLTHQAFVSEPSGSTVMLSAVQALH